MVHISICSPTQATYVVISLPLMSMNVEMGLSIWLYTTLSTGKHKLERSIPDYLLSAGETTHSLERASVLRQQIGKLYNEMEIVSKRIMNLKPEDESEISDKTLKLQLNVRAYTINYIQVLKMNPTTFSHVI